jgi:hypothetical protein
VKSYIIFSIQLQTYLVLFVLIGTCIQYYPVILYRLGTSIMSEQLFGGTMPLLLCFFVIFSYIHTILSFIHSSREAS